MKRPGIAAVGLALVVGVAMARLGATSADGGNSITSPDAAGDVGRYTSLVLDAGGNPVISYYDRTNEDLKLLHCGDPNCTSGNSITSPDTEGDVGWYTSLTLDAAGNPVVGYLDVTNHTLEVLHCNDPNCAGGDESVTSPDLSGAVGEYPSVALDAGGNPVVSYRQVLQALKVMHCNDPNCAGGDESIAALDMDFFIGLYTSLELDSEGNPVVSYYDWGNGDLKVLRCGDPDCTSGNSISAPDTGGNVGWGISLALDAGSSPVVSYYDETNGDLKVLHCGDADCTWGNSITSPDTDGNVGWDTSMALDADGNPVISYHDETNGDLKVLHCGDDDCTSGNVITSPDTAGWVGAYTSLALDASGNPVVSYWDVTNGDLKVLHCGDPNCSPSTVGGIAELPEVAGGRLETDGSSGGGTGLAAVAAGAIALSGVVWYARRRLLR